MAYSLAEAYVQGGCNGVTKVRALLISVHNR